MKIGIISDTHLKKDISHLLRILDTHLSDVDTIIHGGDYTNIKVINMLKKYKNFIGVWGNVDDSSVRKVLEEKAIFEVSSFKIGVYHGHGTEKTTIERAYNLFAGDDVDIIIFGHSHQPVITTKGRVLMLNPGSPTRKRSERWFSCIVLEILEKTITAELKLFK